MSEKNNRLAAVARAFFEKVGIRKRDLQNPMDAWKQQVAEGWRQRTQANAEILRQVQSTVAEQEKRSAEAANVILGVATPHHAESLPKRLAQSGLEQKVDALEQALRWLQEEATTRAEKRVRILNDKIYALEQRLGDALAAQQALCARVLLLEQLSGCVFNEDGVLLPERTQDARLRALETALQGFDATGALALLRDKVEGLEAGLSEADEGRRQQHEDLQRVTQVAQGMVERMDLAAQILLGDYEEGGFGDLPETLSTQLARDEHMLRREEYRGSLFDLQAHDMAREEAHRELAAQELVGEDSEQRRPLFVFNPKGVTSAEAEDIVAEECGSGCAHEDAAHCAEDDCLFDGDVGHDANTHREQPRGGAGHDLA